MNLKSVITCVAALFLSATLLISTFSTVYAEEDAIVSSDFEDEEIGSWLMFGGGTMEIDDSVAHTGTKSIKASNRKQTYQGPSLNCDDLFMPNETYDFDGWVYHEQGVNLTMSWTIRYLDATGNASYAQIKGVDVPSGEWVELQNSITIPETAVSYLIYFECSNENADFYVDDITINGKANSASYSFDNEISYQQQYLYDFEADSEMWNSRGDVKIIHTDEYSNTGTHSIYVTGRNATWNGPTLNVSNKISKNQSYHYSANVMYNGEEYEDAHVFRLEIQYTINGADSYNLIAEKEAKKGKWTMLDGYYTVPDKAENISIYVQTANLEEGQELTDNDTMSFYVDTVQITDGRIMLESQRKDLMLKLLIIAAIAVVIAFIIYFIVKRIRKNKTAMKLVSIDAMTKVLNRNSYEKKIEELENDIEQCKSLYYALCDVNFLKYINDNHGHEKGDEVITRCAKMLSDATGTDCKVYRTGGDEFVCISKLPIDEKIRNAITEEAKNDKGYPFAVACGFAVYDENNCNDIKSIIAQCDKNMYADKQRIKSENKEFSRK
ncbi:MAG: carbohydrate binding domain-containing protein [Ruminococcus sp.]|nr:carbohydrate binding domain-containing protein [Ruminococcus sp.]